MMELNGELVWDVRCALNSLALFSNLNGKCKIPLHLLNYKSLYDTRFSGDNILTQALLSSMVSQSVELIQSGSVDDGEIVLRELEEHCEDHVILSLFEEYMEVISFEDEEEACLSSSSGLEFLSTIGMRYVSIKVPFATDVTESTLPFLKYIPFLIQTKFNLDCCLYVSSQIEKDELLKCVRVDIFYIQHDELDFLDDMEPYDLYTDFSKFVQDENRRMISYVGDK